VLAFLADGPGEVVAKGADAALGTLAQSVLGAITIVSVAVAIWAVKKLSSVQDERTKDAKEAADKLEKTIERMLDVQGGVTRAIDAVTQSTRAGEQVDREQSIALAQIKQTLETTIRDAIRYSRGRDDASIRPSQGGPPQPPSPSLPSGGTGRGTRRF
jgi:hypothetical protein